MAYAFSVFGVIILSTVILAYILRKQGVGGIGLLIASGVSSLILSLVAPLVFDSFLSVGGEQVYYGPVSDLLWYIAAAMAIYMALVLFASAAAAQLIAGERFPAAIAALKSSRICKAFSGRLAATADGAPKRSDGKDGRAEGEAGSEIFVDTERIIDKMGIEKSDKLPDMQETVQNMVKSEADLHREYLDELFPVQRTQETASSETTDNLPSAAAAETSPLMAESATEDESSTEDEPVTEDESANEDESVAEVEFTAEDEPATEDEFANEDESATEVESESAAVDVEPPVAASMPVDADNHYTAENPSSAEDYISRAFELKQNRDYEGAILNYMYALDNKPGRQDVFWIILDICVLYKDLGQARLAREILQAYSDAYSDVMDSAVRLEIERNLSLE